jgi:hypothetical protein
MKVEFGQGSYQVTVAEIIGAKIPLKVAYCLISYEEPAMLMSLDCKDIEEPDKVQNGYIPFPPTVGVNY